jgi:Fe-S cluster biogenesis protein NfuA/nitrite reductase/ring-hydroxylating ferredoxin subunit
VATTRNGRLSQEQLQRIDALIQEIEATADPATQSRVNELLQALLEFHSAGLERMLELVWDAGEFGQTVIDDFLARDELVCNLMLLHGLHPLPLETRVMQALDKVRPYLGSHGGDVELLGITPEGVVQLRLQGSCHGCGSSRVTLEYAIEEGIYAAAPDIAGIEVEGMAESQTTPAPGFIPVAQLLGEEGSGAPIPLTFSAPPARHPRAESGKGSIGWVEVDGLATLGEGSTQLELVVGLPVLFCRVGNALYAYQHRCPACGESLRQARLAGRELTCAACGHRYDVQLAGRDPDDPKFQLQPFPLLEETGRIRVRIPDRVSAAA